MIDPENCVVALCAEGIAREGEPAAALRLFEQAWAASLYLNLADAHEKAGERAPAALALQRAAGHLDRVPDGGYREFVAGGIRRLAERLDVALHVQPND